MGSSIAVTQSTFNAEVLDASHQKPVLVDFFATWCGPCKMLKPILEKLAQEYDFILAKVDIDENPELAQAYSVQGVPDVRVVVDGQVNEGFVGVLPEPDLRQMMAQLNLKSSLEGALEAIYDTANRGDVEAAQTALETLLQEHPDSRELRLEAANFYIESNQIERADTLLVSLEQERDYQAQAKMLRAIIFFKQVASEPAATELDQTFQTAATHVLQEQHQVALDLLLAIARKDRRYRNDGARKAILSIFDILGDEDPITREYRRKLTSALY